MAMFNNSKEINPAGKLVDMGEDIKAMELDMEELSEVIGGIDASDFKFREGQLVSFTCVINGKRYSYSHVRITRKKYTDGIKFYYFRVKTGASSATYEVWIPEPEIVKVG